MVIHFIYHDEAGCVGFYIKKILDFQLVNNISIGLNSVEDL